MKFFSQKSASGYLSEYALIIGHPGGFKIESIEICRQKALPAMGCLIMGSFLASVGPIFF
jgi:hypothetical protein